MVIIGTFLPECQIAASVTDHSFPVRLSYYQRLYRNHCEMDHTTELRFRRSHRARLGSRTFV